MPRKPPNPKWGSGHVEMKPAGLTAFEKVVAKLKLEPEQYTSSRTLRDWVRVNRNTRYVPEELLVAFGMSTKYAKGAAEF